MQGSSPFGALGLLGGGIGLALAAVVVFFTIVYIVLPFYIIASTHRLTSILTELQQLRRDMHDLAALNRQPQA